MTGLSEGNGEQSRDVLRDLPKAAIQAIYHHATGKTENMSQSFRGNVLIRSEDIDNLYHMVIDQLGTHTVEHGPTVTIYIKQANERSVTHSSWEHFKKLSTIPSEVTSEITLKFEFVLDIQNAVGPQRCIVTINLDSALPLLEARKKENYADEPWQFLLWMSRDWETAKVSIDFVDFMVARGFANIVKEWFDSLKPSIGPKNNVRLLKKYNLFDVLSIHAGRLGFAAFLAVFCHLKSDELSLGSLTYAASVGMALWAVYLGFRPFVTGAIFKRLAANVVPSIIAISQKDDDILLQVREGLNSTRRTFVSMIATAFSNLLINLFAAYLFVELST